MKKTLAVLPVPCCSPGAPPLPADARADLAARFKALADPTRVGMVNLPAGSDELCVCAFVAELGLSQPTISHHQGYYGLVPEAVAGLAAALGGGADAPEGRRGVELVGVVEN
jgi:ArsR family transcriptional regulator